jgi:hypothetical protein
VILGLALLLLSSSAGANEQATKATPARITRCTANRQLLIGAWSMEGVDREATEIFPNGDSYEFQFVVESGRQIYREYLHFRPGLDGTWTLRGCRLTVGASDWRRDYHVLRVTRTQLSLREVGGSEIERFTRITR